MNTATYSPEDNKLRLYVGRVPRDEYERLRAEGWTSTPKQSCDFVAVWTPTRRDTALEYADIIEDEDQGPEDRAADRAERFGEYRDKRTSEAIGHADRYDAGPSAHGYQSQARAERSASRHDRNAGRACDSWSKAEYWQQRTAGVISHALHNSSPGVRMGRIKTIEAELRKTQASLEAYAKKFKTWQHIAAMTDPEKQTNLAKAFTGIGMHWSKYPHPVTGKVMSLWSLLDDEQNPITGAQACALFFSDHKEPAQETEWTQHYKLRLAYENQMLEAQGGRAAFVEMVAGGWIGERQIRKVNKSPATGRVVSVTLKIKGSRWGNSQEGFHMRAFNIERLPADSYTPPSEEDLKGLTQEKEEEKAAAPVKAPCPLINPTDADAERLQSLWNERAKADHCARFLKAYGRDYVEEFKPSTVCRISQATYSANSKGSYARTSTESICYDAMREPTGYGATLPSPKVCQLRTTTGDGSTYGAPRVIILTDKPQKPFPASVWNKYTPAPVAETVNA